MAELHLLGSPPLVEAALAAVCAVGARVAEPGEFTLRAFLAGRIDLTQAEAVLGVIDAVDRRQLDAALAQLAGGLAKPLNQLRNQLLDLLAHLEAGLDFVEEDIELLSAAELEGQLAAASHSVKQVIARLSDRADTTDVVPIVLVGYPNVGKSSLFNALVGRPAALVSDSSGTTRDCLSARLELEGVACELVDTAGIGLVDGSTPIGRAARQSTAEQSRRAAVRLLCLDATRPLNAWERAQLTPGMASGGDCPRVVVWTKTDLCRPPSALQLEALQTSSRLGWGLGRLGQRLGQAARSARGSAGERAGLSAVRCRESLLITAGGLERACRVSQARQGEELVAAELAAALDELGRVVGAVYADDVLDRIFSRFCIGK
jgi:tRNA modification GTPase